MKTAKRAKPPIGVTNMRVGFTTSRVEPRVLMYSSLGKGAFFIAVNCQMSVVEG